MDDKNLIVAIGIVCFTVLEIVAMYMRLDGQIFATVIAAIVGIIGLAFGVKITTKKEAHEPGTSD